MSLANTRLVVLLLFVAWTTEGVPQQTSKTSQILRKALQLYPEADADKDGVLTMEEALTYQRQNGLTIPGGQFAGAANKVFSSDVFQATAEELDQAMKAGNAANAREPLEFPKGNGLRIVSTGHSWVGPALRTLPEIARGAGLDGQHIRSHTGGGGTGSANSIWKKEFGKYDATPARPILLPAIATGQWDVMTWGSFYGDTPENYSQWIDVCLSKNPEMVFYIQDGWPTFDKTLNDSPPEEALREIDAAQARNQAGMFQELYDALSQKYPGKVHLIPAGGAVVDILHRYYSGQLPQLDCVSENLGGTKGIYRDGGHLSRDSGMEWLVGYLYYGMLYQRSPQGIEGLHPAGVAPEVDAALRDAAWKAIISSPYSGVVDVNGDGIGEAAK